MRLKFFTIIIIAMFTILICSNVLAATGTVELKSSTSEVKKGDNVTVIIAASSEDGLNGIDTTYTYDSDKLELVSENIVDPTNWGSLAAPPMVSLLCFAEDEEIKSADLYCIKFKVKENVSVGDKISIEINDIILGTFATQNSEIEISSKKLELTVVEDTEEPNNNQDPDNNQEPGNNEELNNNQEPDNSEEPNTSADYTNDEENEGTVQSTNVQGKDNIQVISDKKGAEKTDTTASKTTLPKTGINYVTIVIIAVAIIIIAIVFYKKYTYIKDIK